MKVDFNTNRQNTSFGHIIEKSRARNLAWNRLKHSPSKFELYDKIITAHIDNPLKIILDTNEKGSRFIAKINSTVIKENWLSALFKVNPAEFLAEIINKAEKI